MLVAGLAGSFVVALVIGGAAFVQWNRANGQRDRAEAAAVDAQTARDAEAVARADADQRALEFALKPALEIDTSRGLLLVVEARRREDSVTTRGNLQVAFLDEPFYVGKGTGQRLLAHGIDAGRLSGDIEHEKVRRIREIRAAGDEPLGDVVRQAVDEPTAFHVEAALIDCLPNLTNRVRGMQTEVGRTRLDELVAWFGAESLATDCEVTALLIALTDWVDEDEDVLPGRMGGGYRPGLTEQELYDANRVWWRMAPVNADRRGVKYAVPVYDGVTRALYKLVRWIPDPRGTGRWGFEGKQVRSGAVFDEFVGAWGKSVPSRVQNPIRYWPPR